MNLIDIKKLADEIIARMTDTIIDSLAERIADYVVKKEQTKIVGQEKAAEYIGKTYNALGQMCYRGEIPYHKIKNHKYFKREDLDKWLTQKARCESSYSPAPGTS